MSTMNITKSKFMEYIRCDRYAALNHIYKRKDLDDAAMDRYYDLIDSLEQFNPDTDDDILSPDLEQLQIMMPYFTKIEELAARKIISDWGGETRYGTTYGTQKLFLRDHRNFNLMCYVDIYNKQDNQVNIIEVKATTTNKFLAMGYTENKVRHTIFEADDTGILRLREERDPTLLENRKYLNQRKKLFERFTDEGAYVYDLAFQRFVIDADVPQARYYLGVLNHEYVHDGETFEGEPVYDKNIITLIDLTTITEEMMSKMTQAIDLVVDRIIADDESRVRLGKHCQLKKQRECIFKDLCYDRFPKKNSILMYIDKHHGFKDEHGEKHDYFDLIDDDYLAMTDVPHEWLNRRNNQIQRDCALTQKPYVDQGKIRDGIAEIRYPIYHLDFESFPCPLPRFAGEKAYTQSLFQFSLHIEHEPGVCDKEHDHIEYLAPDHADHRLDLVQAMCAAIPRDGGSVMVYNQAFEKTRIRELAALYPQYADHLADIADRLFDLMHIVKTNTKLYTGLGYDEERAKTVNFYHEDLAGSYSIKKVLPIFSELTYQGMRVGNGMEAVYAYASFATLGAAERAELRHALIEYCKQDTWAMVEILAALRKI
mgnify:FL=1